MKFLAQLQELGEKIFLWIKIFLALSIFFFLFGFKEIKMGNKVFSIPYPSVNSITNIVCKKLQTTLLPSNITLMVTNPIHALLVQIEVAFLLGFLVSFPLLFYKIVNFVNAGLYANEKKLLRGVILSGIPLFFAGCVFSYLVIIPLTLNFSYTYVQVMGVTPFFEVQKFISFVFLLIIGVGLIFMLPVFMQILSRVGVIPSTFWRRNWRYAIVIVLVICAVITPDGTGITMGLLFAPVACLYSVGCLIS